MKQGISLKKTSYAAYAVAAVLFVIFSVYMLCFEKTVTFSSSRWAGLSAPACFWGARPSFSPPARVSFLVTLSPVLSLS